VPSIHCRERDLRELPLSVTVSAGCPTAAQSVKLNTTLCGPGPTLWGAARGGLPRIPGLQMSHTILIADDSIFIRKALCSIFEREADFDVCGQAENGKEAVEKAKKTPP
jgi:hypothetical protein